MPKAEFLIVKTEDVPKRRLAVGETEKDLEIGQKFHSSDVDLRFVDDNSLGSIWTATGIIRSIAEKGGHAILLLNKMAKLKLPKGEE